MTLRGLLATVTVVVALFVSSCGGSADPYVGTWALDDPVNGGETGRDLVITPTDQGYLLAFEEGASLSAWLPLTQRGEELVADGDSAPPSMRGRDITLSYDAARRRLLFTEGAVVGLPYVRVSDAVTPAN